MNRPEKSLPEEFSDKDYRTAYAESMLDSMIATQIKVLRDQRNLTQAQLAELSGMRQSRISALENVNYSAWSISTLKKLASALDVALTVRFESFADLVKEAESFSMESLKVPSYEDQVGNLFLTEVCQSRADVLVSSCTTTTNNAYLGGTIVFERLGPQPVMVTGAQVPSYVFDEALSNRSGFEKVA